MVLRRAAQARMLALYVYFFKYLFSTKTRESWNPVNIDLTVEDRNEM